MIDADLIARRKKLKAMLPIPIHFTKKHNMCVSGVTKNVHSLKKKKKKV